MKKTMQVLMALMLCAALLTGCGGTASAPAQDTEPGGEGGWSSDVMMENSAEMPEPMEEALTEQLPQAAQGRKIIHNARLNLESKEYDKTYTQLMDAVRRMGGYVESSSEEGNAEAGNRWAEYVLRIPSDHYQEFLQAAGDAGSLVRKEESTQDVTQSYVDVQARLESLRVQEQRLLELAAQAQNMEDLLAIESKLADVHYMIESYTVQQRTYDDQIDFSTITVTLWEVTVYTPTTFSFSSRVQDALGDSWTQFVDGCQNFVIGLIYALPTLVVLAIVAAVVVPLWKRHRRNAPARRAKREAKRLAKAERKQKAAAGPVQREEGSDKT